MKQDLFNLTRDMVAIRSVSRQSNVQISDYVEQVLKSSDFEVERLEYLDENDERKVNLVGKKGAGTGGLAFASHSDTVPGEEEAWDAFNLVEKDGRLYGRGSCDMKGPLAATMVTASAVDAAQLRQPVFIIVTADEETGSYGAKFTAEQSLLLSESPPNYGIVAEPTHLIPAYAQKGAAEMTITAHGRAAHTSIDLGVSANFLIAPFLAEMAALREQFLIDETYMNREFVPPTNGFNMIVDDGGTALNVTAPKTICQLAWRIMPDARSEEILELITTSAQNYGFEIDTWSQDPVYTPPDSRLVQVACEATGHLNPVTVPFRTDSYYFKTLMDVVILGPGEISEAHTIGESIALTQLEEAVKVYGRMIEALCM